MKKFIMGLLLLCTVILFAGCSFKNLGNMDFLKSAGKKKIDKDIKQIIKAMENRDASSIKKMMAEKALNEIPLQDNDIDVQIKELFDFYQGTMKSCTYKYGRETTRHGDEGDYGERIIRMASGTYDVTTDKDRYLLQVYDNVKSVVKEEEGIYCISIIKYNDYYNLNLMDYLVAADSVCGVHVTDMSVMEELEYRLNDKGETGFDAIIDGYARTTACCCAGYKKGYKNQVDRFIDMFSNEVKINKQDVENVFEILNFNMGNGVEVIKSGFSDHDKLMYCEGIARITDVDKKDCPTKYRIKMKWQKCKEDSKSGLTYFAIMSEEDFQAGKKFKDGKGLVLD